jgi:hypothetical protein
MVRRLPGGHNCFVSTNLKIQAASLVKGAGCIGQAF